MDSKKNNMNDQIRKRSTNVEEDKSPSFTESRVAKMFGEEETRIKDKMDKAYMPYRFWCTEGKECEVTILDASLDEGFARHEHNIKGADGKYGNILPCVRNHTECPLCKSDKDSVLVLYLSVLVHRPYVHKKTGETINFSKMFLCIKRGQLEDFGKVQDVAMKKHKTLRGVTILLKRGTDKTSYSNGKPTAGDDGNIIVDFYSEEQLVEYFGDKAKIGENGKVLRPENDTITPYDYKKLMPKPDVDAFLLEHGGSPAAGSRKAYDSYKDEDSSDYQPSRSVTPSGRPTSKTQDSVPTETARVRRRPIPAVVEDDDDIPFND